MGNPRPKAEIRKKPEDRNSGFGNQNLSNFKSEVSDFRISAFEFYFACSNSQFTNFTSASITWSGFWISLKTEL